MGMITFLLMLFSSDNGARRSDGDDYVSPDALYQTTGPREVMGMITSCLLMFFSSDNRAEGSDGYDYVSPDALFIRQQGQGKCWG